MSYASHWTVLNFTFFLHQPTATATFSQHWLSFYSFAVLVNTHFWAFLIYNLVFCTLFIAPALCTHLSLVLTSCGLSSMADYPPCFFLIMNSRPSYISHCLSVCNAMAVLIYKLIYWYNLFQIHSFLMFLTQIFWMQQHGTTMTPILTSPMLIKCPMKY